MSVFAYCNLLLNYVQRQQRRQQQQQWQEKQQQQQLLLLLLQLLMLLLNCSSVFVLFLDICIIRWYTYWTAESCRIYRYTNVAVRSYLLLWSSSVDQLLHDVCSQLDFLNYKKKKLTHVHTPNQRYPTIQGPPNIIISRDFIREDHCVSEVKLWEDQVIVLGRPKCPQSFVKFRAQSPRSECHTSTHTDIHTLQTNNNRLTYVYNVVVRDLRKWVSYFHYPCLPCSNWRFRSKFPVSTESLLPKVKVWNSRSRRSLWWWCKSYVVDRVRLPGVSPSRNDFRKLSHKHLSLLLISMTSYWSKDNDVLRLIMQRWAC